jgi:hypothetical protein
MSVSDAIVLRCPPKLLMRIDLIKEELTLFVDFGATRMCTTHLPVRPASKRT